MLNVLFYWFFRPQIYVVDWHAYMLKSIVFAAAFVLLAMIVYCIIPYRREKEPMYFWLVFFGAIVCSLTFILWETTNIPDEYARSSYKLLFVLNFMISTIIWEAILFYIVNGAFRAKKYFPRILEYLKKAY
jgi:hypothetical protein